MPSSHCSVVRPCLLARLSRYLRSIVDPLIIYGLPSKLVSSYEEQRTLNKIVRNQRQLQVSTIFEPHVHARWGRPGKRGVVARSVVVGCNHTFDCYIAHKYSLIEQHVQICRYVEEQR